MRSVVPTLLIAAALFAAAPLAAQDIVVVNEDGFTSRDGFWWRGGEPYSRQQVSSGGGYYRDYYGRSYYVQPTYSYSYYRVPYVKQAVPKLVPPPYTESWRVEVLKYAQKRDDVQAYLDALKALGLNGQQYSFQQSSYAASYAPASTPALGTYGAQGSTTYGYSYQQVQQAYGDVNLNALYLQQGRLTRGAQELAAQAHTEHSQLVGQAGDQAARIAEIAANAAALRSLADAVKPQGRITTVTTQKGYGTGTGPAPGTGKPMMPPASDPDAAAAERAKVFLNNVAVPLCGACHSGTTLKGKFDILSYPTLAPEGKAAVYERLTTKDEEKRMPRKGEPDKSQPGDPLTPEQLRAFLTN